MTKLAKNKLPLKLGAVDDDNINSKHLGTKGLHHLNLQGSSRLTMNVLTITLLYLNIFNANLYI